MAANRHDVEMGDVEWSASATWLDSLVRVVSRQRTVVNAGLHTYSYTGALAACTDALNYILYTYCNYVHVYRVYFVITLILMCMCGVRPAWRGAGRACSCTAVLCRNMHAPHGCQIRLYIFPLTTNICLQIDTISRIMMQ